MSEPQHRVFTPTRISQYIRLETCPRFLRLDLHPEESQALRARFGVELQPLTPLLAKSGRVFEESVQAALRADGWLLEDLTGTNADVTRDYLRNVTGRVMLLQAMVAGRLGGWEFGGQADLIALEHRPDGRLDVRIADIKATRRDRVEHRIQVACYVRLLEQMADAAGVEIAVIEGAILRRPETGDTIDWASVQAFDLAPYRLAVDHLLADIPPAARDTTYSFAEVPYHLGRKCDGCRYNQICFIESGERGDLSLIPYLGPVEKKILQAEGLTTVEQVAALTQPAERGVYHGPLPADPAHADTVEHLRNGWQVGARLDRITQFARAIARQRGEADESREYAIDAPRSSLPDETAYEGLVKVFLDVQFDYVAGALYLLGALVVGPGGERNIVELSDGPPKPGSDELADEGALLQRWLVNIYRAVVAVAGAESAYLHLYFYDRFEQKVLLEALGRHTHEVFGVPAFFNLLTTTEAAEATNPLAQPMVSFLATEVQARLTLNLTCQSLHSVARRLGFKWDQVDGQDVPYTQLFRTWIFDNQRPLDIEGHRVWVESASRYNSTLPLEYAYGAWKRLPGADSRTEPKLLRDFSRVTPDDLRGFQAQRLRALQHIEGRVRPKNGYLGKEPIPLPDLATAVVEPVTPPRALQEFLLMEHYTRLHERLLLLSQPIEQRARTGRAALLECRTAPESGNVTFRLAYDAVGLKPDLAAQNLRLKEGDWVVLNPIDDENGLRLGKKLLHGHLATIEAIEEPGTPGAGESSIRLRLMAMSFKNDKFRYGHWTGFPIEPGGWYTLDEMGDDMSADRYWDACVAAETHGNPLIDWILAAEAGTPPEHDLPPEVVAGAKQFGATVAAADPFPPTEPQAEVIAAHLNESVFLVQGPPGTGKSQTLGWAILSRIVAHRQVFPDRPYRVAVCSNTHNAINIVLQSLATKAARLADRLPDHPATKALAGLQVMKVQNGTRAVIGAGISVQSPQAGKRTVAGWFQEETLVLGATGTHLAAIMKTKGGRDINWSDRPFDLLVIDEASQVNLPQAVLAAAFLKAEGQMLAVGDHRQMPPIYAHDWEEEERETVRSTEVFRSVFDYLRRRQFPNCALDESFRLHRQLAAFLADIIYHQDGVAFHSRREHLLDACRSDDPYVRAVLDPRYPVVVIEHDEALSQQFNEVEADLLAPIVNACLGGLGLNAAAGMGIVVPHRAQRAYLNERFPDLAKASAIDTVERFQGGERDVIVVSATASDPDYVLAEAEFLLNPNRLNVALSRPRLKLIVIASTTVYRLLTADLDLFENATLWKRLRYEFAADPLWAGERHGHQVRVHGRERT